MAEIKSPGLTLLLFFWAGLVCAQENGDGTETPVNLRPFQLILPRDHLFGDWYGLRSKLEDQGFTPTLSFVTNIAGNRSEAGTKV
jgi:porin